MTRGLINSKSLNIRPNNIDSRKHFYGAFGNNKTEVSAKYIVKLCQKNDGWYPFTKKDIEILYHDISGFKNFMFNNLISDDFIVENKGLYFITTHFILRCAMSSYTIGSD